MYCRKCGKKIADTDHFCQFCGSPTGYSEPSPTPLEIEEEIIFNPPYEDKPHSKEDEELKEFISENEIEEAQQEEAREKEEEEPEPVKTPEFTWNVYEFPTDKKKTEDVEFNWNMEDFGKPEQKSPEAAAFEEELFQEIRDDSNRIKEQNIDRFFTFSRKNEEFQELLDREYEKFKMRTETPAGKPQEPEIIEEPPVSPEEAAPESGIPEAVPLKQITVEHISEMEQARAQYFGEDLIRDNESIRRKLASTEPEKIEAVENDIKEEKEAEEYIEPPVFEAPTEPAAEQQTEEPAAEPLAEQQTEEPPAEEEPEEDIDGREESVAEEEKCKEERHRWSAGQIALTIIAVILVIEIAILGIRYFAPESSAAKAIGDFQTKVFSTVSGWLEGDGAQTPENGSDDQEALPEDDEQSGKDNVEQEGSQTDTQTKAPAADPNPMADKNALVSSQMGNNKNIEQIKANETLAWQQGKNYGLSDINNSKPITNNIWQAPETGDPVYYDKSVIGAVIAFDSQWIDYVNNGDKSVLSITKKDSEAYRKSVNYSKIGKIKETFKLLEIGEIRQGTNGFYLWAHEEIMIKENGKTTDMKYNWIYYLEPADGQMKIVNYYHF